MSQGPVQPPPQPIKPIHPSLRKAEDQLFERDGAVCRKLHERKRPWPAVHVEWATGRHQGDKEWIPVEEFRTTFTKIDRQADADFLAQLLNIQRPVSVAYVRIPNPKGGEAMR